jgi:hypothetical protein
MSTAKPAQQAKRARERISRIRDEIMQIDYFAYSAETDR